MVDSFMTHNGHKISKAATQLSWPDRLGSYKVRWGMGRMKFIVAPGIYAVGDPDSDSPVFVSANYKMSFDRLRSQLTGRDGWILVLDTKGINVWCAAGKGTFGTDELVNRIKDVKLDEIVNHRTLILPQLSATGVSAHKVKQQSDFRVVYGPVHAKDLPAFLDAGMKATGRMRRVEFPLWDRAVLIPIEIVTGAKYLIITSICFLLLSGLNKKGYSPTLALDDGLTSFLLLLTAFLAAAILGPILLPLLPGRAFSVKGLCIGLAVDALIVYAILAEPSCPCLSLPYLVIVGWLLIIPAITSFVVMNFTGASTYTSLSGVRREMRIAVPLQLACAALGIGLWIAGRFL